MPKKSASIPVHTIPDKHGLGIAIAVDLDDCDNILRIDSPAEVADAVTTLLMVSGFDCEELF